MMREFVNKDGKKLRMGYTTGSCAAAASKAAAVMLLGEKPVESVYLMTPKGIGLTLEVLEVKMEPGRVSCAIRKDAGDDPDVTDGMLIFAEVKKLDSDSGTILVDGGEGIGRVTKPGMNQPVGAAAINSVPRRMIAQSLRETAEDYGYTGGLSAVISAPDGAKLAERTFNPRLGIVGGLSILGTTGIVEPMSDEAVVETTRIELNMRAVRGDKRLLLTPGNYGEDYIRKTAGIDPKEAVKVSNFIGAALENAAALGFEEVLLIGHIGKIIKLAGGMMNTHSRYGDCRAELFTAHAALCGAGQETADRLMGSAMTDDMLDILAEAGLKNAVMESIMKKVEFHVKAKGYDRLKIGVLTFSNKSGFLGATPEAVRMLEEWNESEV